MSIRTHHPHRRILCVLAIIVITSCNEPVSTSLVTITPPPYRLNPRVVSVGPMVTVRGGSAAQIDRLAVAVERFAAAGLALPEVEVVFSTSTDDCKGHLGLFSTGFDPWRISICSTIDSVYEHELAHAWERATLTDEVRRSLMRLGGYRYWSDREVPWNKRGVEWIAVVIQQGLAGLPLSPSLGRKVRRDLQAFELLTGMPAPRLVEWIAASRVTCDDRPTTLSRIISDASGTVCSPTRERFTGSGGMSHRTMSPSVQ